MHLSITAHTVVLNNPQDLTAFDASTARPPQDLTDALPEGMTMDESHTHLWVDPQNLRQLAGDWASDPEWNTRFEAMIAYATAKGWRNEHGMLRAHLILQDTDQV